MKVIITVSCFSECSIEYVWQGFEYVSGFEYPRLWIAQDADYVSSANISTSDQRCFNVVDQRWNNVDLTSKMKEIRRWIFNVGQLWYNVSVRRWNNIETMVRNFDTTLYQPCYNVASTSAKLKLQSCISINL